MTDLPRSSAPLSEASSAISGRRLRIGFFINPYAGAGGPAGLKGSDDPTTKAAVVAGEIPARAPSRAQHFLEAVNCAQHCEFITVRGAMGEDIFSAFHAGNPQVKLSYTVLDLHTDAITSAEDTQRIAQAMQAQGVDVLLFLGGDGTARDVCKALGTSLPVLGIPSGVKMHSGVFAITPECAAKVLDDIVLGELVSLVEQEVRDIDEAAFQKGVVKSRYFGDMRVPDEIQYMQNVKQGGVEVDELVLMDIAADIRERLDDEENASALTIFATGSTVHFIEQELGCEGTLLGVDVYQNNVLVAKDVSSQQLETLVNEHDGKVIIILTAIGGQGYIIGRGNQQLSPKVLKRAGRENIWVVATKTKLEALSRRPLLIDSNDPELDLQWQGLIPVITGYRDQVLYALGLVDRDSMDGDSVNGDSNNIQTQHPNMTIADLAPISDALKQALLPLSKGAEKGVEKDCFRIFHGRGKSYPGLDWLNIDYFTTFILITVYRLPEGISSDALGAYVREMLSTQNIFVEKDISALLLQRRDLPNAPFETIYGELPEENYAWRNGCRYALTFSQQNIGYFLDIEAARGWLEKHAQDKSVLNLFSYTCTFSVVAKASGASGVVNMDLSRKSLQRGRDNHRLNTLDGEDVKYFGHDIFKSWGKLKKLGPYDIVIVDPPSYQKGSFVATKDYAKVLKKMAVLTQPDGYLLACLNAPEITHDEFKSWIDEHCEGFSFCETLQPGDNFPEAQEGRGLKMLVYRKQ